jgi:hypothetical protein
MQTIENFYREEEELIHLMVIFITPFTCLNYF